MRGCGGAGRTSSTALHAGARARARHAPCDSACGYHRYHCLNCRPRKQSSNPTRHQFSSSCWHCYIVLEWSPRAPRSLPLRLPSIQPRQLSSGNEPGLTNSVRPRPLRHLGWAQRPTQQDTKRFQAPHGLKFPSLIRRNPPCPYGISYRRAYG